MLPVARLSPKIEKDTTLFPKQLECDKVFASSQQSLQSNFTWARSSSVDTFDLGVRFLFLTNECFVSLSKLHPEVYMSSALPSALNGDMSTLMSNMERSVSANPQEV